MLQGAFIFFIFYAFFFSLYPTPQKDEPAANRWIGCFDLVPASTFCAPGQYLIKQTVEQIGLIESLPIFPQSLLY
jgi:hypothetical protein